jgi:hypothetical protein
MSADLKMNDFSGTIYVPTISVSSGPDVGEMDGP